MACKIWTLVLIATGALAASVARAEVTELKIAQQYGISLLPFMVMEHDKLIEKNAKAAGLGDLKVTWANFAGPAAINDAFLSGNVQFASTGAPTLLTFWAKTRGTPNEVRGVSSISSMPSTLVARNPAVRTLRDFTERDKIALPAVKIGLNAIVLQMAAEKVFGEGNYAKLDPLTVTLSHPDATTAMLSGAGEITAHFSQPPFSYQEIKAGMRSVLRAHDVLGGGWDLLVYTTAKFHNENPRTYAVFLAALREAEAFIQRDKKTAAQIYLKVANDKRSKPEDILAMLNDPEIEFTMAPQSVMTFADFMYRIGAIKVKPASWKDVFFPEIYNLPGR